MAANGLEGPALPDVMHRRVARLAAAAAGRAYLNVVGFAGKPDRLAEFTRYVAVSATALIVDLAAFSALVSSETMAPKPAGATSVLAGLAVHYALSMRFVFDAKATGKSPWRLAGEYALTGVLGVFVTWVMIAAAVELIGLAPGLGKLAGVGATFITVYIVRAGIVFRTAAPGSSTPAKGGLTVCG